MPDTSPQDPRREDEKALADLKRNDAMGLATPESPAEEGPSVTPETFGVHDRADTSADRPPSREDRDDPLPEMP